MSKEDLEAKLALINSDKFSVTLRQRYGKVEIFPTNGISEICGFDTTPNRFIADVEISLDKPEVEK